jgi:hypothetical protein
MMNSTTGTIALDDRDARVEPGGCDGQCLEAELDLAMFLDGTLSEEGLSSLLRHAACCVRCHALLVVCCAERPESREASLAYGSGAHPIVPPMAAEPERRCDA